MKRWITTVLCASVFFLFSASLTHAQEQSTPQITVVQKVTHEDGTTSVVKKRLNSQAELEAYLEQNTLEGADVDLEIIVKDGRNIDMQFHNNHSTFEFSRDFEFNEEEFEIKMEGLETEMKELQKTMHEMSKEERFMRGHRVHDTNRAILGIYPESDGKEGIAISSTVRGSGSEAAGLQGGDVVIKVNEVTTNNVTDLRNELSKFNPGHSVNVVYLRNGQEMNTMVVLSESKSHSWTVHRDPCKVFIGVYVGGIGNQGEGVKVSGVINETPASISGVQKGDLIVALDDIYVNSHAELLRERNKHNPGDYFTLTVFREGQELDIDAQFLDCDEETEEIIEEIEVEEVPGSDGGLLEQPSIDINNTLDLEDYRAFPNPTYGEVNVSFIAEAVATDLQIVDATGKVIYQEDLPFFDGQYNKEIDLSNGTPGVIIINIRQGDKIVAKKVVLMARA